VQKEGHQGVVLLPHLAVARLPGGQLRAGGPQGASRLAIKTPLTATARPLPEYGHGHDCAPAQRGRRSRTLFRRPGGRAQIIDHDVQRSQEGVHIDQSHGSLSWGRESNFTGQRRLPFNR
jgi:hypothetical protein